MTPRAKQKGPPVMGGNRGQRLKEVCFISASIASFFWLAYTTGFLVIALLLEVL
jgi:hypothetical protein